MTVQQILWADRAAWTKLIEVGHPIRRNAAGDLPSLIQALQSYEVGFDVAPLRGAPSQPTKIDSGDSWKS